MVAKSMLEELGCKVDVVSDGEQAAELFEKNRYHLVFMDCQMPVLDGYRATQRLREIEKRRGTRTPVVAMTAHALAGDREKCVEAGMDDYVAKPISPEVLAEVLGKWVEKQRRA